MKNLFNILRKGVITLALVSTATMGLVASDKATWGDFKLFLDPGHALRENQGLYGYSESEKVLRIAWTIREYLKEYTDITDDQIKLCRETDTDYLDLTERSDMANAWDADFYYSIHSDASGASNTTLFLFGGWNENGVGVEKTPKGGKYFGDILNPNLSGVMRIGTRGNCYDRAFYEGGISTHANKYPYLSVNRRANMASLLSEGGYHTLPTQQPLNINESYKRLEGYASFRSILQYRGLKNPVQPMLVGVITNSENNVPANGVTVTVDGRTVVTDSYESLFKKYSNNPNLIHNGFFMFEGLVPGQEYEVQFSSPEFGVQTKRVTMVSNPDGLAADNVTWCDVQMTSTAPAKVDATSIENPLAVSLLEDAIITFSRNMNKESVEAAFTITNNGKVKLTWDNDYALRINISQLMEEFDYIIKIDGAIAKNAQTGQFLDGNGDGVEGGDYVLEFVTLPPDVTDPFVKSSTPAHNSTMLYTVRPAIRLEFNEQLNWNEDKVPTDIIRVFDAANKEYEGIVKHEVIAKVSVVHFYLKENLPLDRCFKVTIGGGLPDMAGNLSSSSEIKFLSEYRPVLSSTVVDALNNIGGWYQPHGSGSSKGWTSEAENTLAVSTETSSLSRDKCFVMNYAFDVNFIDAYWQLRVYKRPGTLYADNTGVLQTYVYGDGSNNGFSHGVRANSTGGGVKYQTPITVDFRGWNVLTWKLDEGPYVDLSGVDKLTGKWLLDNFFITHQNTDDAEDIYNDLTGEYEPATQQAWSGMMKFDDLKFVKYDNTVIQKAKLDDISSVEQIETGGISIVKHATSITITAPIAISSISVYGMSGKLVIAKTPNTIDSTFSTNGLAKGVYIVKAITDQGQRTMKVIL